MNVSFSCPVCERPARWTFSGKSQWQCPGCDHFLSPPDGLIHESLPACVVCGNKELYKKKDFPHWLGLLILTGACLISAIPYWLYHQWLSWAILIGSAAFDGLLYLWVGDVIVCYRCQAHYRQMPPHSNHAPFDLGIGERYRQERIRREQLRSLNKGVSTGSR
jgi:hypothetical protein